MATTIKLKNSVTTTNAPSSLVQGEVAINVTDKKVWVGNAATTPVQLLGTGADASFTNLAYTGTLTGGTGVVNLGSGQVYKDASGNVGIGTSSPANKLDVVCATNFGLKVSDGTYTGIFTPSGLGGIATGTITNNPFIFISNNAERMRIDTSGNVGIGTSSPATRLHVVGDSVTELRITSSGSLASTAAALVRFGGSNNATSGYVGFGGTANDYYNWNALSGASIFGTANSERMRIDSSGNLLVGTTSGTTKLYAKGGNGNQLTLDNAGETYTQLFFSNNGTIKSDMYFENSTTRFYIRCNNSGGVYLGSGGTSWTSASDERVKDIIEPITNGAEKVASLRAVIGKYKTDVEGKRRAFLIAQDVQAVLPEAVDATDSEQLGVAYSDVIPLLVAAIQEQQAIITDLKARIETLENK